MTGMGIWLIAEESNTIVQLAIGALVEYLGSVVFIDYWANATPVLMPLAYLNIVVGLALTLYAIRNSVQLLMSYVSRRRRR